MMRAIPPQSQPVAPSRNNYQTWCYIILLMIILFFPLIFFTFTSNDTTTYQMNHDDVTGVNGRPIDTYIESSNIIRLQLESGYIHYNKHIKTNNKYYGSSSAYIDLRNISYQLQNADIYFIDDIVDDDVNMKNNDYEDFVQKHKKENHMNNERQVLDIVIFRIPSFTCGIDGTYYKRVNAIKDGSSKMINGLYNNPDICSFQRNGIGYYPPLGIDERSSTDDFYYNLYHNQESQAVQLCCTKTDINAGYCNNNIISSNTLTNYNSNSSIPYLNKNIFKGWYRSISLYEDIDIKNQNDMNYNNMLIPIKDTGLYGIVFIDCMNYDTGNNIHLHGTIQFKSSSGYLPGEIYYLKYYYIIISLLYILLFIYWSYYLYQYIINNNNNNNTIDHNNNNNNMMNHYYNIFTSPFISSNNNHNNQSDNNNNVHHHHLLQQQQQQQQHHHDDGNNISNMSHNNNIGNHSIIQNDGVNSNSVVNTEVIQQQHHHHHHHHQPGLSSTATNAKNHHNINNIKKPSKSYILFSLIYITITIGMIEMILEVSTLMKWNAIGGNYHAISTNEKSWIGSILYILRSGFIRCIALLVSKGFGYTNIHIILKHVYILQQQREQRYNTGTSTRYDRIYYIWISYKNIWIQCCTKLWKLIQMKYRNCCNIPNHNMNESRSTSSTSTSNTNYYWYSIKLCFAYIGISEILLILQCIIINTFYRMSIYMIIDLSYIITLLHHIKNIIEFIFLLLICISLYYTKYYYTLEYMERIQHNNNNNININNNNLLNPNTVLQQQQQQLQQQQLHNNGLHTNSLSDMNHQNNINNVIGPVDITTLSQQQQLQNQQNHPTIPLSTTSTTYSIIHVLNKINRFILLFRCITLFVISYIFYMIFIQYGRYKEYYNHYYPYYFYNAFLVNLCHETLYFIVLIGIAFIIGPNIGKSSSSSTTRGGPSVSGGNGLISSFSNVIISNQQQHSTIDPSYTELLLQEEDDDPIVTGNLNGLIINNPNTRYYNDDFVDDFDEDDNNVDENGIEL